MPTEQADLASRLATATEALQQAREEQAWGPPEPLHLDPSMEWCHLFMPNVWSEVVRLVLIHTHP